MLISTPPNAPGLGRVVLTDVPGVGANVTRHEEHLLQQLQPMENDAVILTMSALDKLDTAIRQRLLWLVKNVMKRAGFLPKGHNEGWN